MKKLTFGLLCGICAGLSVFPALALAATGSLNFTPPATDVSVVFLGNIFGPVDGVLHGSGSEIMGQIFSVFNAAVLALGGIIIMYTLMVSTVNTAHEGQMLGQKWSSMWVPVRATLGLSLLIPKASGYCLMQIFVMWVVVQGVGAADKVWDAALNYLNRGGVIIQQQINPITSIMGGNWSVLNGAATILYGQVCMAGLEAALTNTQQGYLNQKTNGTGPCYAPATTAMTNFCTTPVPDFLASVNASTYQSNNPAPTTNNWLLPMPNFPSNSPYNVLNGACGSIGWNLLDTSNLSQITDLGQNNINTASLSRAIAIQQMYSDLAMIAKSMISNDPKLTTMNSTTSTVNLSNSTSTGTTTSTTSTPFAPLFAQQQFGVPYSSSGSVCPPAKLGDLSSTCVTWGSDPSSSSTAPLFDATQFQGAVSDYNAIMLPTLNLITQANNSGNANQQRAFIQKADSEGWMLAGSYFFSLVNINSANTTTAAGSTTPTDTSSGLEKSTFSIQPLIGSFDSGSTKTNGGNCHGNYPTLCQWLQGDNTSINYIKSLFDGSPNTPVSVPSIPAAGTTTTPTTTITPVTGQGSSTVYGFVTNSLLVQLPGQPGQSVPKFVMNLIPDIGKPNVSLPNMTPSCGTVKIFIFGFCLIEYVVAAIYDYLFVPLYNFFLTMVTGVINTVVMAFLALPLIGMAQIFQYGVSFIEQPGVNPIVALANMGVNYINYAADLWIYLLMLSIASFFLGPFGIFIMVVQSMSLPLLMAWLGVMVSVGFTTAYFIPFLPYMIFTFGTIAWLMAVIEAMVAAPIVALGVTHPEGEGPFGKGENAIMILMNVFLRPALMIIGYIAGIILSYVGVWIINAGFSNVLPFIQGTPQGQTVVQHLGFGPTGTSTFSGANFNVNANTSGTQWIGNITGGSSLNTPVSTTSGYTGWAGVYGFFFSILIYTMMYLTVVQKSFTLIGVLPDKVLRWIGGTPETAGTEAAQWTEDVKGQVKEAGAETAKAQGQMSQQMGGAAMKGLKGMGDSFGEQPDVQAQGEQGGGGKDDDDKKGGGGGAPGGPSGGPPDLPGGIPPEAAAAV